MLGNEHDNDMRPPHEGGGLLTRLKLQIVDSDLFVVLGTKNYLHSLKTNNENILYQVVIAKRYNKPTLLIIDKDLSKVEVIELEGYFSEHNVVKEIILDLKDPSSWDETKIELERLMEEHEKKNKK